MGYFPLLSGICLNTKIVFLTIWDTILSFPDHLVKLHFMGPKAYLSLRCLINRGGGGAYKFFIFFRPPPTPPGRRKNDEVHFYLIDYLLRFT